MSIADKITSIENHLKDDYQSIANLGADLTNVDKNIENIAELLDGVYDNLPKTEYGEGTEINLGVTTKGKLDYDNGVVGIGQTEQDGTPTPTTPIEIKSVTGNQDVVVSGKNKNSSELEQGAISSSGTPSSSTIRVRSKDFIEVKAGTTYTASGIGAEIVICEYQKNETYIGNLNAWHSLPFTFTTSSNCEKIKFLFGNGSAEITPSDISNIQLEQGSTATTYEPYITPTSYQLSLGDKELYEDCTIVGSPDNWKFVDNYKKEYANNMTISSVVELGDFVRIQFRMSGTAIVNPVKSWCNVAPFKDGYSLQELHQYTYQNYFFLFIPKSELSTIDETGVSSYLSNHIIYVVYKGTAPIETPITDETLISQLNAWYNAHSLNGTTIITSNGNLPMIIKCRGLKGE